jgi:hypothetical protein
MIMRKLQKETWLERKKNNKTKPDPKWMGKMLKEIKKHKNHSKNLSLRRKDNKIRQIKNGEVTKRW